MSLLQQCHDILKELEWSGGDYDRGGDYYTFCPYCLGAQHKNRYVSFAHTDSCDLFNTIVELEKELYGTKS